jgi:hypothetical protein
LDFPSATVRQQGFWYSADSSNYAMPYEQPRMVFEFVGVSQHTTKEKLIDEEDLI